MDEHELGLVRRLELLNVLSEAKGVIAGLENARPQELTPEVLTDAADHLRTLVNRIEEWRL